MCASYAYEKYHLSIPYGASSGGGIPMLSKLSKESRLSLGETINFIDHLIQWFELNYENIIMIYKINMSELFKTIPK